MPHLAQRKQDLCQDCGTGAEPAQTTPRDALATKRGHFSVSDPKRLAKRSEWDKSVCLDRAVAPAPGGRYREGTSGVVMALMAIWFQRAVTMIHRSHLYHNLYNNLYNNLWGAITPLFGDCPPWSSVINPLSYPAGTHSCRTLPWGGTRAGTPAPPQLQLQGRQQTDTKNAEISQGLKIKLPPWLCQSPGDK